VALVTHLAFELRTSTPDSLVAALAEQVETSGYRSLWVNHPPDEAGLGQLAQMAAATTRITLGTAVVPVSAVPPDAILRRIDETSLPPERLRLGIGSGLPTYAAHFSRSGIGPGQTWIAARQLGELPGLLEPWRDTVDEVVLVPVSAEAAGPARDLVDAAIAAF